VAGSGAAGLCAPPQLVVDGQPNACLYGPGARKRSLLVFGRCVDELYAMKAQADGSKNRGVMLILNGLVGALEAKNEKFAEPIPVDGEIDEFDPEQIREIHTHEDAGDRIRSLTFRYATADNPFKFTG